MGHQAFALAPVTSYDVASIAYLSLNRGANVSRPRPRKISVLRSPRQAFHCFALQLNLTGWSSCTSAPAHTHRVLIPGLATRSLFSSTAGGFRQGRSDQALQGGAARVAAPGLALVSGQQQRRRERERRRRRRRREHRGGGVLRGGDSRGGGGGTAKLILPVISSTRILNLCFS